MDEKFKAIGRSLKRHEAAELLIKAKLLIDAAQAKLDRSSVTCGGCKLERANNWQEEKIAQQLGGIITKLVRFDVDLRKPAPVYPGHHGEEEP